MRFSERYGYKPVREIIQKESMDDDLRNSLLQLSIFEKIKYVNGGYGEVKKSNLEILIHSYWFHFFKSLLIIFHLVIQRHLKI